MGIRKASMKIFFQSSECESCLGCDFFSFVSVFFFLFCFVLFFFFFFFFEQTTYAIKVYYSEMYTQRGNKAIIDFTDHLGDHEAMFEVVERNYVVVSVDLVEPFVEHVDLGLDTRKQTTLGKKGGEGERQPKTCDTKKNKPTKE